MLSPTGSPDSLAAILTTSSTSTSAAAAAKRHHSPIRSYGALAFLNFFFHRVTRSGPKLLLYLALLLASLLVLTKCLPTGISNSIVSSTSHLWEFRPGGFHGDDAKTHIPLPGENNAHDALAGGGLRIVVFGENDIATSMLPDIADPLNANNGTSWTRELCVELGCTTYLSYVPVLDSSRRSLSSNPLYGAATDEVLRDSKEKKPADDYTYITEEYPITWEAPDLYTQVAKFLEQPAPQRPPKETVWVLTSGMWDVWSLAAFPYDKAESYVIGMVFDLFSTIETLYDAAHDVKSIAYSNYSMAALDEKAIKAGANQTADANQAVAPRDDDDSELAWEDASSEPFRVVIPLLFDPSLVPGWHLDRPTPPALHTKPEQLRNAVRLTKRWNDFVASEMDKWTKKNVTFIHPDERPNYIPNTDGASDSTSNDKKTDVPNISAKQRRDNGRPAAPNLYRDGIVFRMSDYVMDMIIDGQLRMRGIADKKGFGKLPKAESFLEVDKPCVAPEVVALPSEASKITTEVHFENGEKKKEEGQQNGNNDPTHTSVSPGPPTGTNTGGEAGSNDPTHTQVGPGAPTTTGMSNATPNEIVKSKFKSKRQEQQQDQRQDAPAADVAAVAKSSPKLLVCDNPDRHLFFTPFSLGQRAIEEVGRLSAAIVRANRSTRAAWEKARKSHVESDRDPASWKEYYYEE